MIQRPKKSFIIFWLSLTILLGVYLRLIGAHNSVMFDEAVLIHRSSFGLSEIIKNEALFPEIHPPFYYVLYHFYLKFGSGDFFYRLFSIIFGVASLPLLYVLGEEFFGKEEGMLATFILAIFPFHIWISQEVRTYSFFGFIVLLSLYYLKKFMDNPKKIYWVLFIVTTTLSAYTHFFGGLILAVYSFYVIYLIFDKLKTKKGIPSRQIREIFIAISVCFILLLPGALYLKPLLSQGGGSNFFKFIPIPLLKYWGYLNNSYIFGKGVYFFIFLALFFISIHHFTSNWNRETILLLFLIVIPIIIPFFFFGGQDHIKSKFFVFVVPIYILLVSNGFKILIEKLNSNISKKFLSFLLIGSFFFSIVVLPHTIATLSNGINPEKDMYRNNEWEDAALYIKENIQDGDVLITNSHDNYILTIYLETLFPNDFPEDSDMGTINDKKIHAKFYHWQYLQENQKTISCLLAEEFSKNGTFWYITSENRPYKWWEAYDAVLCAQSVRYVLSENKIFNPRVHVYRLETFVDESLSQEYGPVVLNLRIDEGNNDILHDETENKNNGKIIGTVLLDDKGLFLDGKSYIKIESHPSLKTHDEFSVFVRAKTENQDDKWSPLVSKGFLTSHRDGYMLGLKEGKPMLFIGDGENFVSCEGRDDIRDGRWHNILGVYGNRQARIYIDGEIVNSCFIGPPQIPAVEGVIIGKGTNRYHSEDYFKGSISQIIMWNKAVSATEIDIV